MDPNPIKHAGSLLKHVRERVDAALVVRGYAFRPCGILQHRSHRFSDYRRGDELISLSFSYRTGEFLAELMDANGECRTIAKVPINRPRNTAELLDRCDVFAEEIVRFLESLPTGTPSQPENP